MVLQSFPATVDVIAPSNMQEGYQFNVESGGKTFLVAVPPGGVMAGARFSATVISEVGGNTESVNPHNIPSGHWRDGLCDCCKFGLCHPLVCCAFWCSTCALGQIMQRLRLDYCGKPRAPESSQSMSTYMFILLMTVLAVLADLVTGLGSLALLVYFLIIAINTRSYLRRKYSIPTQNCGDCEDCCCAYWCTCCVVSQMGRHTADFEHYGASCCGETGLQPGTPAIV